MKNICLALCCLALSLSSIGQLKAKVICPAFDVDILEGKVNTYKATAGAGEIKAKFPCFTSATTDSAKCGEAIYFKDKDITFYTSRDYIEIGEKFKGKLSVPLIGASRGSLFKVLGHPKMKDDTWDAFQTAYGTLVLHYNKANKVKLIQFSTKDTNTLSLCE
ncbi:hypothetical protein [Paraflavitalea sp. CAU 1676]|uniref:hypothetical protein n=1 Tax=Paraflavitalea sp. CAU 1676 TaxID=3032598 RepID=UPI0023DC9DC4|nr:hypothetical protein [Paraflavitalea sp. CAU 1676]MDF2191861.1 hypothetical protein [Paraflavitalea sp. CAU 1676]